MEPYHDESVSVCFDVIWLSQQDVPSGYCAKLYLN